MKPVERIVIDETVPTEGHDEEEEGAPKDEEEEEASQDEEEEEEEASQDKEEEVEAIAGEGNDDGQKAGAEEGLKVERGPTSEASQTASVMQLGVIS